MNKSLLTLLLLSSAASASDMALHQPSMTSYLPDSNSLTLEYEQKNYASFDYQGIETSSGTLNKEKYFNLYYISPKLADGRVIFTHTRDSSSGINSSWDGTVSKKSTYDFKFQKTLTHLGYARQFGDLTLFAGMQRVLGKAYTEAYPTAAAFINEAEDTGYGYLVSASYKIKPFLFASVNYESQVDMTLKGTNTSLFGTCTAQADIAHPAKLNTTLYLYTSKESLWLLGVEKKFWTSYKELDIDYSNSSVESNFGATSLKNWQDIMIYSFGHQHTFNKLKLLGLVAMIEDPTPDSTRDFGTPNGEMMLYVLKASYAVSEMVTLSTSLKSTQYSDSTSTKYAGTFSSESGANVMNVGVQLNF